jgi:hypothetical protein
MNDSPPNFDSGEGSRLIARALEASQTLVSRTVEDAARSAAASWLLEHWRQLATALAEAHDAGRTATVVEACSATLTWFLTLHAFDATAIVAELGVRAAALGHVPPIEFEAAYHADVTVALNARGVTTW